MVVLVCFVMCGCVFMWGVCMWGCVGVCGGVCVCVGVCGGVGVLSPRQKCPACV